MNFQKKLDPFLNEIFAVYGIADIKNNQEYFKKKYGSDLIKYPYAISVANPLSKEIIEDLSTNYRDSKTAKRYLKEYHASHDRVNNRIEKVKEFIQNNGYYAEPIYVSGKAKKIKLKTYFAHLDASTYAGLGWKGKNSIFINPKYGPRLTWATILTNAPLIANDKPMENKCGDCHVCSDNCPVNAIKDLGYNKYKYKNNLCSDYIQGLAKSGLNAICGICIYTCPYGKND